MSFFSPLWNKGLRPSQWKSGIVRAAIEEMRAVKVPRYLWDIFQTPRFDLAKAIFSHQFKKDPTPGWAICFLQREVIMTLESYYVDKHLSSRIPTNYVQTLIPIIENGAASEYRLFKTEEDASCCNRTGHLIGVIQHSWDKMQISDFREVQPEVYCMMRIEQRIRIQVEARLIKELPPPQFESKQALQKFTKTYQEILEGHYFTIFMRGDLSPEDDQRFNTYCKQFFDERNRRMVAIFKAAWEKDKALREKDPNASLLNLVTIDRYENEIWQKRKELYLKTAAAILTLALFFFLKSRRSQLPSINHCFLIFS